MTTEPTAPEFEPSEEDWADMDRFHICNAARDLVEKAMSARQVVELTLAFGLKPDAATVHAAEQEAYALDYAIASAMDWS
jgi:hypothetical protein